MKLNPQYDGNIPEPRSSVYCCASESKIYFFGGYSGKSYLNDFFEYDPGIIF
jgi:hypothetical protein